MKEKAIILSTEMVQALLNTKPNTYPPEPIDASKPCKGMIRRVAPFEVCGGQNIRFTGYEVDKGVKGGKEGYCLYSRGIGAQWETRSNVIFPKYQVGDVLWVREKWSDFYVPEVSIIFKADKHCVSDELKWKPSIHMPREAARIFLKVRNVCVERLQNISEEDAKAEGVNSNKFVNDYGCGYKCPKIHKCQYCSESKLQSRAFMCLWDSLYAKKGYGWDTNPYVWVYEFERVEN
ncbi:MAG: hypothetical protein Ta2B_09350 [Termitinemataceae bacterium]|nr:MAG: hypothetical protein Ta2B_09350 [Termitinemataceae bacterium]